MNARPTERPIRIGLVSLGCAKNLVDAEIMLGALLRDGVVITNEATEADAVIVNTCSFIESAQQESVDAILELAQMRDATNCSQALIVSGCLPQRFRDELPKVLPEVDAFMGIDQVTQAPDIVRQALARRSARLNGNTASRKASVPLSVVRGSVAPTVAVTPRPRYVPDFAAARFRLTPRHFAYVKIAEGCNHPCSFCTIPQMRGSHRSRSPADIVAEAGVLIAEGVKELNLISQDSTYYGMDLRPGHRPAISSPDKFSAALKALPPEAPTLCTLLRQLNALPGDFWIRLLYTHPAHWTADLIQTIAECPKVARYVDIPLQHIHENMLERMRRETSREYIVDLLARIRTGLPGIALRTTFIVGFPGETEEYFEALIGFIRQAKFERLGVFTYSQEESTRAGKMAGQIPDRIKRRRRDLAMAAQREVARRVSESFVGRTIKVLVEGQAGPKDLRRADVRSWEHGLLRVSQARTTKLKTGNYAVARGEADAPDIDGRVYVRGQLPFGDFAQVRILGHTDYDLIAESV